MLRMTLRAHERVHAFTSVDRFLDGRYLVGMAQALSTTPAAERSRRKHATERWQTWTPDKPPANVRNFLRWWVEERRVGETFHEYARKHGLKPTVVRGWLRDERVQDVLERMLYRSNAGPVRVQEVIDMLYRRATTLEDVQAAKLYLQHVDKLVTRTQVDVVVTDARTLSDDDLRRELTRAVALLEKRELPSPVEDAEVISDSLDEQAVSA
jgi:hypothetical protein